MSDVTVYTVADSRFFPGTAVLLNSLRLTGNEYPVSVLDAGLEPGERERLERHAEVVDLPSGEIVHPQFLKPFPYLLETRGVIAFLDSDMIVTKSLEPTLDRAREGGICLFGEHQSPRDRWFREWQEAFELRAPLRRQPYLNSGFVAFSVEHHPSLLERWWQACKRVPLERTRAHGAPYDQPFWHFNQDALNALLMSEVPAGAVFEQRQQVSDALQRVRIEDSLSLACGFEGRPAILLHYTNNPKPWEDKAWMRVRANAYVRLFRRLAFGDDVPLRLAPHEVPVWLRPGALGSASLRGLSLVNGSTRAVVRNSGPLYRHFRRFRARLAPEA